MLRLAEITAQFNTLIFHSKQNINLILAIMAAIWVFNAINWATGSTLNILGTIPRSRRGIFGNYIFLYTPRKF